MKRLKNKLLKMENDTATYTEMYNGTMCVVLSSGQEDTVYDSCYYCAGSHGEYGFDVTQTHKLAQDAPTVVISVPAEHIINGTEEDTELKRLKYHLLQMENDTKTYDEMYEGRAYLPPDDAPGKSDLCRGAPGEFGEEYRDNVYYHGGVSVEISSTHKLAKDKPTLTYHIPADSLGINDDNVTTAAADYCLRAFAPYIDRLNDALYNRSRPDNENGKYYLHRPGGEVVKRNTAYFALCPVRDYEYGHGDTVWLIDDGVERPPKMCLCIRLQVQLPKRKLRKTIQMLCRDLPDAVEEFVTFFGPTGLSAAVALSQRQSAIRAWLKRSDYCAFIANGSILPRSKGTDLPMEGAVPFSSVPEDEIEVCGVRGMGIRRGVTVVTGGGYSGKSTLLDAISAGIYDHVLGDGRELVITDDDAVTVSAEDGRAVRSVNISPFVKWLPGGDTKRFSTDHASGSTSQAANIMEAVDCGARLLLIDEDRSAANFMIRDGMMKSLIKREPLTPFTDRARELSRLHGVSTILVIGGSGEYLAVADRVYMMDEYRICDVTGRAKEISSHITPQNIDAVDISQPRTLSASGFSSYPDGKTSERLEVSDLGFIIIGDEKIDVRGLHDIVAPRQLDALGFMLRELMITQNGATVDIRARVDELYDKIEREGLDTVYSSYFTTCERFLDLPRKYELYAVISRMRHTVWNEK